MIGHYLLSLTPEQEDRVLTKHFEPMLEFYRDGLATREFIGGPSCLVGTATNGTDVIGVQQGEWGHTAASHRPIPGVRYEWLVGRFGLARVNAAIRNRILANRARRTLQHQTVSAHG